MGLTWKPRGGGRSTFDGSDSTGRHCGYATNISGPWTVYLTPWACGRDGGLVLGPFEDARDAMAPLTSTPLATGRTRTGYRAEGSHAGA